MSGPTDRRMFLRLLSLGITAPLIAACNAQGTPGMLQLLDLVGTKNEKLERWLLSRAGNDRVKPGVRTAGAKFPSYFISDSVPTWDPAVSGAWQLVVDGAVRTPLRLDLAQLQRLATRTQTVNHYCVEGWTAAVKFQGVPMSTLAKMAQPTRDAGFVDFSSFDEGYHESWDIESTMHPQTMVAIAKDGELLSPRYGAPARVHSPVKLGYKNTKYLTRITFMPKANGGYWSDLGYEWYGGT
ncbi:molybdopterin-dependent oxidoreductase [Gemmatimonas groenlandica]|uniref:Molybdopterin-dependent oxidoreductase n=1 Tax=Gemmatimonas groenlandica TaxID=2732249 RepID=A0A6M4ITX2_9BACT|nr:molybdopterin-dependent oxidoreductase [Gemmatimonas groenlandica]QJR36967.1 molybdopterin-dependent oxidoreductase [Gemmatimonas groenlandica]